MATIHVVIVLEADREVKFGLLLVVVEFALKILRSGRGSRTKRHSQELICSPSLHVLFVEQVQQQILVPLDEPLRIDLSMFELLISVPLNSLQQSTQRLLLLLPQQSFLLLHSLLHFETYLVIVLLFFELFTLDL